MPVYMLCYFVFLNTFWDHFTYYGMNNNRQSYLKLYLCISFWRNLHGLRRNVVWIFHKGTQIATVGFNQFLVLIQVFRTPLIVVQNVCSVKSAEARELNKLALLQFLERSSQSYFPPKEAAVMGCHDNALSSRQVTAGCHSSVS